MASEAVLQEQTFASAPGPRFDVVLAELLARMPEDAAWRVLDLGCGTGETLFALAAHRPQASFQGVDVSSSSITAARRKAARLDLAERVSFVRGDYMALELKQPFDLIVADQSLYLVPGSTEAVCAKLAAETAPGGVLLVEMPYGCFYNRVLSGLRRVLLALRSALLDRVAMAAARRLYGEEMSDAELHQRVAYLYVVPVRLADRHWEVELDRAGFSREGVRPMEQASPAQLKHRLSIYRKRK